MSSSGSRRRGRDQHYGDDDDAASAAKRPRRRQKHLYLVIDDWEMGYSIHKLDVDELLSDAGGGASSNRRRRLPEPCALRIEASTDRSAAIVAALGSKIIFFTTDWRSDDAPILTYDTETASLSVGPLATPALRPLGFMFAVPVGQRLYAFNPRRADQGCSFEVLSRARRDAEDEGFRLSRRAERWSVASVPAPMPLHRHEKVTAYAVHPDGHTVFVSARNWSRLDGERKEGTHSFDTRGSSPSWTWHGEWQLPFLGEGCYVEELDAWVGLRRDGFLCCCAVLPRGGGTATPPDWKLGRKTMFREDPKLHIGQPTGATLTYMGDSKFCLVECAARQGVGVDKASYGEEDGCVLHVTIFGVHYDKRGDLQTTTAHRARSYLVSRHGPVFAAKAFWM